MMTSHPAYFLSRSAGAAKFQAVPPARRASGSERRPFPLEPCTWMWRRWRLKPSKSSSLAKLFIVFLVITRFLEFSLAALDRPVCVQIFQGRSGASSLLRCHPADDSDHLSGFMGGAFRFCGITGNRGIATISSQGFGCPKKDMWRKIHPLFEPPRLGR